MTGADTLANIDVQVPLSIIVPTYKEVENIPHLIARIDQLRRDQGIEIELLFLDDKSNDGSRDAVADSGADWARLIERDGERGLSAAVLDGFRMATHDVLICMDCDLSHPPDRIPNLVLALSSGQEMVIGSRYVPGGSTDDAWGFFRWLNSRIATLLAAPLTKVRDPMSGFFALRKSDFLRAQELNPVGYKIGLELIVKCGFENIGEVPIHFTDRVHGESKLSLREQLKYLRHVRRLYLHKFSNAMYFLHFMLVGASGVVVNWAALTAVLAIGGGDSLALATGIAVSVVTNFFLNRRFTFSYARDGNIWKQFSGFVAASAVGMLVNFSVALYLSSTVFQQAPGRLYLASIVGIGCGMIFNYLGNRYIVFRKRHIRDPS